MIFVQQLRTCRFQQLSGMGMRFCAALDYGSGGSVQATHLSHNDCGNIQRFYPCRYRASHLRRPAAQFLLRSSRFRFGTALYLCAEQYAIVAHWSVRSTLASKHGIR